MWSCAPRGPKRTGPTRGYVSRRGQGPSDAGASPDVDGGARTVVAPRGRRLARRGARRRGGASNDRSQLAIIGAAPATAAYPPATCARRRAWAGRAWTRALPEAVATKEGPQLEPVLALAVGRRCPDVSVVDVVGLFPARKNESYLSDAISTVNHPSRAGRPSDV